MEPSREVGHSVAVLPVSEQQKTIARTRSGGGGGGVQTLPPSLALCRYNTAIDANKYLCRAQIPEGTAW